MNRLLTSALVLVVIGTVAFANLALPETPLTPPPPGGQDDQGAQGGSDADGFGDATGDRLALTTVWQGSHLFFGYEERTFRVIQTQAEWEALWARTGQEPPAVDFESRTVLVAIYGVARTSGYSIDITDATQGADGHVRVSIQIEAPSARCGTLQVITYPLHMASLPKSDGPFEFLVTSTTHSCA